MSSFDLKSATWDDHPPRRALAQAVVLAIAQRVPLRPGLRLLDVGCGTGLVGLPLASGAASLLGIDLSQGMVDRFIAKAAAAGMSQVQGAVRDLVQDPLPAATCDLVVSAMAFHHIDDPAAMLAAIHACLAPDGWLAVADLVAEDGSFHDEPVPHHGFDPDAFAAMLRRAGFSRIEVAVAHAMHRPDRGRTYPVFLATAQRGLPHVG